MKNRAIFNFALVVLLILSSFIGMPSGSMAEGKVSELQIAIHRDENTLTPFTYVTGYPGAAVLRLVFDSLFILDEQNQPLPWMVADYEVNAAFTEYRISLLPGQFWHDGRPVTADDVAFSFSYPLTQSQTRWRRIAAQVESTDVTDELNLTIRLKTGNPDFLSQALTDMPIIPKHIYENEVDATMVGEALGSGPYRLVEYEEGKHYIFEAVPGYFRGDALVERIVMPIIPDITTIFQALTAGSIHATTAHVAPELVSVFAAERDIAVMSGPGLATTLLQINNEVYPFTLPEMRRAVMLALDLQELVDVVLLGHGDPGSLGFFHPAGIFGTDAFVPERDLTKSNELLDGLGFLRQGDFRVDGNGQPLSFELLVAANNPLRIRSAELIAEQLKEVGIDIRVVSLEPTTLDERVWPGFDVSQERNYTLSIWGWSAPVQLRPDALIQLAATDHAMGSLNLGGFASSEFERLAERFITEMNADARKAIIDEMQVLFARDIPLIPLFYQQVIMAYRPAAYAGWVLQQGEGIINKMSFLPGFARAGSAQEPQSDAAADGRDFLFYLLLAGVLGAVIVVKGRKKGHAS
ncbi:MAG TPA: ABC transporter substrate-binding protein [Candidatus Limnocylindrales bacterium]|nr:ABC transporter substrate-binding protein [Candidatus Limnocylindrales bacterium]